MQASQTLCPYSNQPLSSIQRINEEHVLPVAIGAPVKFSVMASELENSKMNDLIDAPFSNDQLIRFLAMSQGVVSRSGPVTAQLPATVTSSGEAVKVAFSQNGLELKFTNPVVTDPETGRVSAVRGFGNAAHEHAQRIKRDYAKKNINLDIGETISDPRPQLNVSFTGDTYIIGKELLKIAYLMTVWCFGDQAIDSESGRIYRIGLEKDRDDDMDSFGLQRTTTRIPGISCKSEANTHVLISTVLNEKLVTSVQLFGTFAGIFITPAVGIDADDGQGVSVKIDLSTGTITETDAVLAMLENVQNYFES
ncbi:hypothetical protein [Pseudomonas sp. stari2]|uniref:hypothetical protein n=1 Tax=Pseudomonas sp. Stari2 TaxID=2954814 RepID=UPI00345C8512